ncbi:MAG: hypothetical protein LBK54_09510 [Propionibacteriaceae bacterium]|jgi:hypothetical protein|nr:hypothetical protein [Propionibacteriaceae bacterium]
MAFGREYRCADLFCRLMESSPVALAGMLDRVVGRLEGLGFRGDIKTNFFDWWGRRVTKRHRRGDDLGLVDAIENLPVGGSVMVSSSRKNPGMGPAVLGFAVHLMETGRGVELTVAVDCDEGASDDAIADCLLWIGDDLKAFGPVSGMGSFEDPRTSGPGPVWTPAAFRVWAILEVGPDGGPRWRRLSGLRSDVVAVLEPADDFTAPGSYRVLPTGYRELVQGVEGTWGLDGGGGSLLFRLFGNDGSVLAQVVGVGVEALRDHVGGGGVSWRAESGSAGGVVGSGDGWTSKVGSDTSFLRVEGVGSESSLRWVAQAFRAGSYWDVEFSAERGPNRSDRSLAKCLRDVGTQALEVGRLGAGVGVYTRPWSLCLPGEGGDWTSRPLEMWGRLEPFSVDWNRVVTPGPLWYPNEPTASSDCVGVYLPGRDDPAAGRFCPLSALLALKREVAK